MDRNYLIPGEGRPNTPPTRQRTPAEIKRALTDLLNAHIELRKAQAATARFQVSVARSMLTNCDRLEAAAAAEQDSAARLALCNELNMMYYNVITALFGVTPYTPPTTDN